MVKAVSLGGRGRCAWYANEYNNSSFGKLIKCFQLCIPSQTAWISLHSLPAPTVGYPVPLISPVWLLLPTGLHGLPHAELCAP